MSRATHITYLVQESMVREEFDPIGAVANAATRATTFVSNIAQGKGIKKAASRTREKMNRIHAGQTRRIAFAGH